MRIGGTGSGVGTGGMATKVEAAGIATAAGITTVLTSTAQFAEVMAGHDVGTVFAPTGSRRGLPAALAGARHHSARAGCVLDQGAVHAVVDRRKSLLPAGIVVGGGQLRRR